MTSSARVCSQISRPLSPPLSSTLLFQPYSSLSGGDDDEPRRRVAAIGGIGGPPVARAHTFTTRPACYPGRPVWTNGRCFICRSNVYGMQCCHRHRQQNDSLVSTRTDQACRDNIRRRSWRPRSSLDRTVANNHWTGQTQTFRGQMGRHFAPPAHLPWCRRVVGRHRPTPSGGRI
jgi:hypothetical protein